MLIPFDLPSVPTAPTSGAPPVGAEGMLFAECMAPDSTESEEEVDLAPTAPEPALRSATVGLAPVFSFASPFAQQMPLSESGSDSAPATSPPRAEATVGTPPFSLQYALNQAVPDQTAPDQTAQPKAEELESPAPLPVMAPPEAETQESAFPIPGDSPPYMPRLAAEGAARPLLLRPLSPEMRSVTAAAIVSENILWDGSRSPALPQVALPPEAAKEEISRPSRQALVQTTAPQMSAPPPAPVVVIVENIPAPDPRVLPVGLVEAHTAPPVQSSLSVPSPTVVAPPHPISLPIAGQIQVSLQAVEPGAGPQVTEIALAPDTLGRLRLEVVTEGTATFLRLSAESPETQDLLRRQAEHLLQELRNAGLAGASLEFGAWRDRPPSQQAQQPILPDIAASGPESAAAMTVFAPMPAQMLGRALHLRL